MKILLGISGGIAAYKAAVLVRELKVRGHEVRVVMTPAAKDFITPLTLATLSQNPVFCDGFSPEDGRWNSHISLGEWAEVMVIAPATANTLAKMRGGVADNLLLCTYLSARCGVVVAPAMDLDMWSHTATQENLEVLRERGVSVVEPGSGFLASGLSGKGRMAEPVEIADFVCGVKEGGERGDFSGKRVLITSGGTVEPIDSVRFISNHSTGKMGRALEAELTKRGAEVVMVEGGSAAQMLERAREGVGEGCDVAIFAAAVADYTVESPSTTKIKSDKTGDGVTLKLVPTTDIAATISRENPSLFTVGFALEDTNEEMNAQQKLKDKNLDVIVLNSLNDSGAGFGTDTNKITIYNKSGEVEKYPLKTKTEVARDIVDYILKNS